LVINNIIKGNRFDADGVQFLSNSIKKNSSLKELNMGGIKNSLLYSSYFINNFNNVGVKILMKGLISNKNILKLDISGYLNLLIH
jgi:hypothetical protein